jgi:hypothetical protein
MTHGEGGRKRPTMTKHKMNVCAQNSKQVLVHFGLKGKNFYSWVYLSKLGLSAIFW